MRTRLAAGLAGLTLLVACGGPSGQRLSAGEYRELERRQAAQQPGPATARQAEEQRRDLDERSRKLDERRADHAHEVAQLAARRATTELAHAVAVADEELALAAAQRALRLARDDTAHFKAVVQPRRLQSTALDLQASEDRLLETREELAQLELMYGESELGDATAEIVLQRTRRRLKLAEMRHKLREAEAVELEERTLPRELEDLQTTLHEKEVALENCRRGQEKARMERESALRDLAHQEEEHAREAAAIKEAERLLASDRKAWGRDRDDAAREAAP